MYAYGAGLRRILWLAAALAVSASAVWPASSAQATAAFAAQTGKQCANCHVTPGGPLTPDGQAFHDAGDRLPGEPSDGSTATSGMEAGTPSEPPAGEGTGGETPEAVNNGPILAIPDWLHDLLRWAHLVGMTTWLGAIIFVHLVQTPRVAGQGIPRGYLRLAWPAIATLGVSGAILTAGMVPSLGTLTSGRWGLLLLAKIGLYLVLAGVATLATLVVSPRLRRLAQGSESSVAHAEHRASGRVTVGYQGKVYDLSASRLWKSGRHARRHEAWQDLTNAMAGAPHGPEVFETFPDLSGLSSEAPRPVRAFVLLAYGNLFLVLAVLLVVAMW